MSQTVFPGNLGEIVFLKRAAVTASRRKIRARFHVLKIYREEYLSLNQGLKNFYEPLTVLDISKLPLLI